MRSAGDRRRWDSRRLCDDDGVLGHVALVERESKPTERVEDRKRERVGRRPGRDAGDGCIVRTAAHPVDLEIVRAVESRPVVDRKRDVAPGDPGKQRRKIGHRVRATAEVELTSDPWYGTARWRTGRRRALKFGSS